MSFMKAVLGLALCGSVVVGETLPPLSGDDVPKSVEALWADFDPRAEPLDVEVLKEWEEDGVVLKVLRYRIGIFKGQKAMMAAVYGYPKGGKNLPGLVQIHGGGQYADHKAPLTNAKRGYATISISWAGRISAPGYRVSPNEVKLFWEGKTDHPHYKVITDWGALDGYHAPFRYKHGFSQSKPHEHTLDAVASPRNDSWFLSTLGARRALTFLEQQPEVNGEKLGVYGHSMGGKLTVMVAGTDDRVKAAVPSCGGMSHRGDEDVLIRDMICDDAYLKHITCPILFQSPANDFHGRIDDLQVAITEIQSKDWRVTCAPHHNHQDTANYEVASQLWFDQYLKGTLTLPATPQLKVDFNTKDRVPVVSVVPDESMPILAVDVYYTRHGQMGGLKSDMANTKNRFWHHAPATKSRDRWQARLPLSNRDKPLWVYANVIYKLEELVSYAGYYYRVGSSETFALSSLMPIFAGEELKRAGVQATVKPSLLIENFEGDWEKEWFTYRMEEWARSTHKIYDDRWKAPAGAKLALEVRAEQANTLVIGIDAYGAEVNIAGGGEWQTVAVSASDFRDATGDVLNNWDGIMELSLGAAQTLRERVDGENKSTKLGAPWNGPKPEFRNLRWVP